jgi:hypothetical protein
MLFLSPCKSCRRQLSSHHFECVLQNLLLGDQKGNLVAFALPPPQVGDQEAQELCLTGALKAAHGISAVPMVAFSPQAPLRSKDRTVTTVGRDGCICTHLLQPEPQLMTARTLEKATPLSAESAVRSRGEKVTPCGTKGAVRLSEKKAAQLARQPVDKPQPPGVGGFSKSNMDTVGFVEAVPPTSSGRGDVTQGSVNAVASSSSQRGRVCGSSGVNHSGFNPAVWLTCTKVERVSSIPSIEWTGFSGTDYNPPVTHLTHGPLAHVPETWSNDGFANPGLKGVDNPRRLAAGFSATEFLVWDLEQQSELVKVTCGGWHRPHSFWIGRPETSGVKTCFVYMKDDMVHVYRKGCGGLPLESGSHSGSDRRQWLKGSEMGDGSLEVLATTRGLHSAFHGRELHCAEFLPIPGGLGHCVLTGGEDGTVRMTR